MTIDEAIDKLKNIRLFMRIEDKNNECKFAEDDYEANKMAIQALEELKQYRAIGTPEELQDMKNNYFEALSDWRQYRKIGTLEECRAAVEKQTAKLVIDNTPTEDSVWYQCPTCKGDLTTTRGFYCQYCGQKLHWR